MAAWGKTQAIKEVHNPNILSKQAIWKLTELEVKIVDDFATILLFKVGLLYLL